MALQLIREYTWRDCLKQIEFSRYSGFGVEIFFSSPAAKKFFINRAHFILIYRLPHDKKLRSTVIKPVKDQLDKQTLKAKFSLYVKAPFSKIDIVGMTFHDEDGGLVYSYSAKD